jgi:hypothetical protein
MTLLTALALDPCPAVTHKTVLPSVPDYNLLLSTVATLSAAVAAIIGGFVLAALLGISSDRNSLAELYEERKRTKSAIENGLALKEREAGEELRRQIYEWLRLTYRTQDDLPSAAELAVRIVALNLDMSTDAAGELAETYLRERKRSDAAVEATIPEIAQSTDLRSFAAWAARHLPTDANVEYLTDAFDRAVASIDRQRRLSGTASNSSHSANQDAAARDAHSLAATELRLRSWHSGPLASDIRRLKNDLDRAEEAMSEAGLRLRSRRLPSHLGLGIAVFIINVGVGVVYPLSMMPAVSVHLEALRTIKIGGVIQMCTIIFYVAFLAIRIRWPVRNQRRKGEVR